MADYRYANSFTVTFNLELNGKVIATNLVEISPLYMSERDSVDSTLTLDYYEEFYEFICSHLVAQSTNENLDLLLFLENPEVVTLLRDSFEFNPSYSNSVPSYEDASEFMIGSWNVLVNQSMELIHTSHHYSLDVSFQEPIKGISFLISLDSTLKPFGTFLRFVNPIGVV